MSYLESFFLGAVQGLGEFLPISSSAHLVIAPWFFKFDDPGLAFDVALHLGTLLAVLAYFWRDWFKLLNGSLWFLLSRDQDKKLSSKRDFIMLRDIALATVPGAAAGLLLKDYAESALRHPLLVAFNMILLGAILLLADRRAAREGGGKGATTFAALVIGCSQALALFPGVSRSGITITTALLLGLNRTSAARFSFLLAMPITLGACLAKYEYFLAAFSDPHALFGIATATVLGFLSIKYLMKLVQNFSYRAFCYYRFFFGAAVIGNYILRA